MLVKAKSHEVEVEGDKRDRRKQERMIPSLDDQLRRSGPLKEVILVGYAHRRILVMDHGPTSHLASTVKGRVRVAVCFLKLCFLYFREHTGMTIYAP